MIDKVVIRRGVYHDSVTLMLAARDAEATDGVAFAAAVMATPLNLELLADQGFQVDAVVGPNDMVVALRSEDEAATKRAVGVVEQRLEVSTQGGSARAVEDLRPMSFRSAARSHPDVNFAFVSVPGRFAAYEVAHALEAGLNVFCFSDAMSLADEAALKRRAVERKLLFMGADCGTALIDGVGFGFVNELTSGRVGVVGASGTGIQQLTCLLDAGGVGISHAIGVGGRDLDRAVGGTMTVRAVELLATDEATQVVAVVAKPPDPAVARDVVDALARCGKPAVVGLLGDVPHPSGSGGVEVTGSLEATAAACARLLGRTLDLHDAELPRARTPGEVRGFFCGGSLLHEAAAVVGRGALLVDYGDDEFTQGRPHPMIDPSLRNERFERDARDPAVGAVIVDVVLGRGAHADPASDLAARIARALQERGGAVTVAVALCGSARDPQGTEEQVAALRAAGAVVSRNAAHAARVVRAAVDGVE